MSKSKKKKKEKKKKKSESLWGFLNFCSKYLPRYCDLTETFAKFRKLWGFW